MNSSFGDIDKYLVKLAESQMLPLVNFMLIALAVVLATVFAGLAVFRFHRAFAFSGGSAIDIRDRRNTIRGVFSGIVIAGAFGSLTRFIKMTSNTFFVRDNTAFRLTDQGVVANVTSAWDVAYFALMVFGVYAYVLALFAFDRAMNGAEGAAAECRSYLFAGLALVNMESLVKVFQNTSGIAT